MGISLIDENHSHNIISLPLCYLDSAPLEFRQAIRNYKREQKTKSTQDKVKPQTLGWLRVRRYHTSFVPTQKVTIHASANNNHNDIARARQFLELLSSSFISDMPARLPPMHKLQAHHLKAYLDKAIPELRKTAELIVRGISGVTHKSMMHRQLKDATQIMESIWKPQIFIDMVTGVKVYNGVSDNSPAYNAIKIYSMNMFQYVTPYVGMVIVTPYIVQLKHHTNPPTISPPIPLIGRIGIAPNERGITYQHSVYFPSVQTVDEISVLNSTDVIGKGSIMPGDIIEAVYNGHAHFSSLDLYEMRASYYSVASAAFENGLLASGYIAVINARHSTTEYKGISSQWLKSTKHHGTFVPPSIPNTGYRLASRMQVIESISQVSDDRGWFGATASGQFNWLYFSTVISNYKPFTLYDFLDAPVAVTMIDFIPYSNEAKDIIQQTHIFELWPFQQSTLTYNRGF